MSIESEGYRALDSQVGALNCPEIPDRSPRRNPWLQEAVSQTVEMVIGAAVGFGLLALLGWVL